MRPMKWVSWMCRSTAGPPVLAASPMSADQSGREMTRLKCAPSSRPWAPPRTAAGQLLTVAAAQGGHAGAAQFASGQVVDHAHEADAGDADAHHSDCPFSLRRDVAGPSGLFPQGPFFPFYTTTERQAAPKNEFLVPRVI